MKTILTLAFCFLVASRAALATDIDGRLLRFSGEIPPIANLVSLLDSHSIANPTTFSATLNKRNTFEYRATTPSKYPTNFDADGKPDATGKRDTGIIFSGDATAVGGTYQLNINFSLVERTDTILFPAENGTTMVQPVFRSKDIKTTIATKVGDWFLLRLPERGDKTVISEPHHLVLLVRVRK